MSTKQLERGFGQGRRIIKDTKHKERINGHENNITGGREASLWKADLQSIQNSKFRKQTGNVFNIFHDGKGDEEQEEAG